MAMTNGNIQVSQSVQLSGTFPPQGVVATVTPLRNTVIPQAVSAEMQLTYGTGSGKANLICCQDRDLDAAGGATPDLTLDLYTGTDFKDLDGNTAAFRFVRYVGVFVVTGGDATGIAVGGAASDAWGAFFADPTDISVTFPGGVPFEQGSPAGVAVGSKTKNFLVENLGAEDVTVRIVIAGSSST